MDGEDFTEDMSLLLEFIAESLEHLEGIDSDLLEYEKNPEDSELIDSIFRAIHSVKGASGFLGLNQINTLAHRLETLLDGLRKGERSLDNETMDLLLSGCDLVRTLIEEISQRIDLQIDARMPSDDKRIDVLLSSLNRLIEGKGGEVAKTGSPEKERRVKACETTPQPAATTGVYKITEKMIADFQTEAFEHLETCDAALIALDHMRNDREAINNLFRAIHSIKGTSAYLGLGDVSKLAHAFEGLLELVRRHADFQVADFLLDLFFRAVEMLREMVSDLEGKEAAENAQEILKLLEEENQKLQRDGKEALTAAPEEITSTDPNAIFITAASQHLDTMKACLAGISEKDVFESSDLDIFFRAVHSLKSSAAYMGFEEIEKESMTIEDLLNDVKKRALDFSPAVTNLIGDTLGTIEKHLGRIGNIPRDQAESEKISEKGEKRETGRESPVENDRRSQQNDTPSSSASQPPARTMRIDQRLLDVFMNLVGELIVARNALGHVQRQMNQESNLQTEIVKGLQKATQTITRISDEMQRNVMEMRMVPVRTVFQKFPRIVRDISRKTGKKVDILLQGEDTEIDKGIAEDIGDPLVHIIRNAVDHGIEAPEVRAKAGKPEGGTIILKASHEGNLIVIDIIDDGAGIDPERILNKAMEKGMIDPEKAGEMSREEILNLIFMPGFSTAGEVTDVSGRGVGMDVVRTNLSKLKGNVRVTSDLGQGTHIRLEVPLTLALIEAMLVGSGGNTYAIPVEAIRETVKVGSSEIRSLMKKKAFVHRGDVIGLEMLSCLINTSGNGHGPDYGKEIPILILQAGNESLGVAVDRLYRKEEIVIKPLADYLAGLPGLAGASILGDGQAILILEPAELIAMATND
ncbi:MAG: chemotaxis protein CheA [Deltaproteobacteria bacterium]|nr:chemotaxis protein CheA [Deltaproteobacteria bacterium]MBW2152140.1 chemotaxis protein CheA [Deltaproteobacteria bacterium]